MNETQLINVENINALQLFTEDGIDPMLKAIELQVADFVPDLETVKGRAECASMAHRVSKAKVVLDTAGKDLVAKWKEKAKVVDDSRKHARAFLDDLRDRVRQPLTEWEAEQVRILAEKKERDELEYMHGEAIAEDFIFEREREIKRREAEFEARENERREREEKERLEDEARKRDAREKARRKAEIEAEEREREEREENIKREAAEKAQRDADEAIRVAEENAERDRAAAKKAEQYLKDQAERAKREAKEAAEKAEHQRLEAIEETKREARQREAVRIDKEHRARRERERKAADVEHRRTINNKILTALDDEGFGDRTAKKIVTLIATGTIPYVSINY